MIDAASTSNRPLPSSCYNASMTKMLQEAIERLQQMPEERQDLLAKLMLYKIEEGERQIATGQTVSHDEAKRRLEKWLSPEA
jgi:predicted transcriptional regulator